ncbi:putative membrane protein [Nakamurella sp. UYEF19]|uniref:DUF2079 domain-containing protein n=1 Tax=Nakamurella sp. UYEF19 TaxID=1756392 RepID=UPI00339628C9
MPATDVRPTTRSRVWIVSLSALVVYLLDSLIRHARFHTGFDLTIFDQAINQYAHLRAPDVLVKSQQPFNILGDHFHPILMLLAPLYRIWPDARMLLVAQALLMALGVHLLTALAVRRLGRFGYFVGAGFASSWGILQAVDFDFHEIAFAVPLLVLALEALLDGRFTRVLMFSGLLMLVKEDSPLLVIGLALALAAQRKYRQALLLGAFGVVSFVLIVFVVIPYFSYSHAYLYFGYAGGGSGGVGGLLRSAVDSVFSLRAVIFVGALALTAGLGLRSPVMLVILPTLGARAVSSNYAYTGFLYHYNATLMVICFVALCDGLARQRLLGSAGSGRLLRAQSLLLAGVAVVGLVRAPTVPSIAAVFASCARCVAADAAIAQIPDGARVAADVFLMPHLVDRTQVMQAYPGFVDSTGLPLRADWVILDLDSTSYAPGPLEKPADQAGWSRTLLDSLVTSGHFTVVDRNAQYVVLRTVG